MSAGLPRAPVVREELGHVRAALWLTLVRSTARTALPLGRVTELIKPRRSCHGLADIELAAELIDWFNNQRLHTAAGHVPPHDYETNYYAQHQLQRRLESTQRVSTDPGAVSVSHLRGLLSDLPRKNGWTMPEDIGQHPVEMQRLLYQAMWDEDSAAAVRCFSVRHLAVPGIYASDPCWAPPWMETAGAASRG